MLLKIISNGYALKPILLKKYGEKAREEGKIEGKSEGKIEVARNLLSQNLDFNIISIATGLSVSELEKLKLQLIKTSVVVQQCQIIK